MMMHWLGLYSAGGVEGMILCPSPSEAIGTLQRSLRWSHHPWSTISPLNSTFTPCSKKSILQTALHSVLTARRLFVIPGHLWAICAVGGSLSRRRSSVSVVFMVAPLGMDRYFAISLSLARLALALFLRSVMDAAESIRDLSFMFTGLVQPEDIVLISLLIKLASMVLFSSAGPPR